jgi:hypothetical protein
MGELPFGIYDTTTLVRYTIPSDIFIKTNGMLAQEDSGDFIVYDTAVDENDQIILEDGTDLDLLTPKQRSLNLDLSGTTTFDAF